MAVRMVRVGRTVVLVKLRYTLCSTSTNSDFNNELFQFRIIGYNKCVDCESLKLRVLTVSHCCTMYTLGR